MSERAHPRRRQKALYRLEKNKGSGKERIDGYTPYASSVIAMVQLFPETEEEDWLLRFVYPILIAILFLITFAVIMYSQTPAV